MPESQRAISLVIEGREGQGLGHNHGHEDAKKGTHSYPKTYACAHTHNGRIVCENEGRGEKSKDYSKKSRVCWFDNEGK